jgi:hypothetical protein
LERLGFSQDATTYLTGICAIDFMDEIAYLDGIDDVDTTVKRVTNKGVIFTTVTGTIEANSFNNGIPVSIQAVANLKIFVFYLKHMERVQCRTIANTINLVLVHSYCDQHYIEVGFKKTTEDNELHLG